jgi:hypothetical protein
MHIARLLRGIEIMGRAGAASDAELVEELNVEGFSSRDSELLVAFVPSAFARPVLEKLGATNFVDFVSVPTRAGGRIDVKLNTIPVYTKALSLVRGDPNARFVQPEHFRALAMRSSEIDAASNALNAGVNLAGTTFAMALVGPYADVLGFDSWLARLRRLVAV